MRAARAHEMKNHLALVMAALDLLEHEIPECSRARLSRVDAALGRIAELISEDLGGEPSSLPAPRGTASVVLVDAMIRNVVGRVCDRAARAGIELVVSCGGGVVRGTAGELVEALVNLVSNAIDASSIGGAVIVATSETEQGDQKLVVQDTGCGMTREILAQVGRPFCSHRRGGSGLGLAVARDVITRHGGLLYIESMPGAGTTLTVLLPQPGGTYDATP